MSSARSQILKQFDRKLCWRVGSYLGSMLYFDFGRRLKEMSRKVEIEIGEYTISIRDVYWEFLFDSEYLFDSTDFNKTKIDEISTTLENTYLSDICLDDRHITLLFSERVEIRIDTKNKFRTDLDILEFKAPDIIYRFTPKGGVYREHTA
jgi:hypothetical protein